jgi:hypothetical protein
MPPRWREHGVMFERAFVIVQFFYAVTLYRFYEAGRDLSTLSTPLEDMDLLWPVLWLQFTGIERGGAILALLGLGAGVAGLLLWRYAVVRVLVSIALLEQAAIGNSFGAIGHVYHEWFWISVCFWFLPGGSFKTLNGSRALRIQFLLVFGGAAALIMLFYSMSGLWKCIIAGVALVNGEMGGFSPTAMAVTVARRALQTGSEPLGADLVINWPILGWPMFLGLYYVELVAILIAFRPALIRAWGVILILFHLGTLLFLDIVFPLHVLINAMLFVLSPFAVADVRWRTMFAALPVIGIPLRHIFGWSAVPERFKSRADGGRGA